MGALVLLLVCKGVAYGTSLSSFRGGPVFPSLFLGAAGWMALSHFAGLPLVPAVAMGIGAMSMAMLKLPLTSVLLGSLLVVKDGYAAMPLVIVAVTHRPMCSRPGSPRGAGRRRRRACGVHRRFVQGLLRSVIVHRRSLARAPSGGPVSEHENGTSSGTTAGRIDRMVKKETTPPSAHMAALISIAA